MWKPEYTEAVINRFDHGIDTSPQYMMSPTRAIIEGADEIRQKLGVGERHEYEIYDVLASEGFTEYVSWPLKHTLGRRHMISFATKEAGGFANEDYCFLRSLVPSMAVLSELRTKNVLARTLLQTYVGPRAAEEILSGSITRGSGDTISAAIMICDMRDLTTISNNWPRDDVIDLLNAYFDVVCIPVEKNGGEILKFMGDGLLAVFPLNVPDACRRLIQAVQESSGGMQRLNEENLAAGRPSLRYGVGIHVGDVMYGNIGTQNRLDFTVIGPAVNLAGRLETMTKTESRAVLMSVDFVEAYGRDTENRFELLGDRDVKGVGHSVRIFALNEQSSETALPNPQV
ncbi:adenylate/guanylate cyclase domain-containing protein [Rhizobium gallicum]|uniref:adenylate/guanylate cyclase domain-containing protein n=1 Tax=Rhizobium gallicum TaxID=56730 RepID=UPI001EF946EE|nr:adenylate/guanylate cyclase domain-containing protein [Rhizobium gallicum]ULJ75792.1 adenylate/guanylate cyclase domain-containing protein [Rhizobium gallicum]